MGWGGVEAGTTTPPVEWGASNHGEGSGRPSREWCGAGGCGDDGVRSAWEADGIGRGVPCVSAPVQPARRVRSALRQLGLRRRRGGAMAALAGGAPSAGGGGDNLGGCRAADQRAATTRPPPCHRAGAGGGNGNDRPGSNPAARGYFGGPPAATQASQTISLGMQRRYQDGGFTWPSRAVGGGGVHAQGCSGATGRGHPASGKSCSRGRGAWPSTPAFRPSSRRHTEPSNSRVWSGDWARWGGGGREVAAPAWPPAARTRSRLVDFPSRYFIRSAHHTRGTACGFDATHWPRGSVIDFKGQSSQCHIGVLHTKHILALTSCQHGGEVSFPHESRAEGLPRFIGCRRTES